MKNICGNKILYDKKRKELQKIMDEKFMKEAIRQAKKAYALMEVPIGCVIVYEGKIIARGYNRRNTDKNTISHAEMNAIRKASKSWETGGWKGVPCILHWNPVRCVPVQLYRQESAGW